MRINLEGRSLEKQPLPCAVVGAQTAVCRQNWNARCQHTDQCLTIRTGTRAVSTPISALRSELERALSAHRSVRHENQHIVFFFVSLQTQRF